MAEDLNTPEKGFRRHIDGLLDIPPGEEAIIKLSGKDFRKIITPAEATQRLADLGYDDEIQESALARGRLSHNMRALILIRLGGQPRVEVILNTNIRILDLLDQGPLDLATISTGELHAIQPVLNNPDMQTVAVKQAIATY